MKRTVPLALTAVLLMAAGPYPLNYSDPAGKQSKYTALLPKILEHWPLPTQSLKDSRPLILRAIKTPDEPYYVGMVKHSLINAPFERVVDINEKYEDYPRIWEDVLEVKVESRDNNRVVTSWTRKSPTFFMPKIQYRLLSITDKSVPGRAVYRQQLIDSNSMDNTDALIVLEKISEQTTRTTVISFFKADFGPFRGVIRGKIWQKSMENSFKDDIAFRARVEHPDWSLDRITQEAEEALDHNPISTIEYTEAIQFN